MKFSFSKKSNFGIWLEVQRHSREKEVYLQPHGRSPTKFLFDQCVVGVTTTDTLRTRDVVDRELPVLKAKNNLGHFIHANHFITSNVHWLTEVGLCQPKHNN